jgi:hypothetical protein
MEAVYFKLCRFSIDGTIDYGHIQDIKPLETLLFVGVCRDYGHIQDILGKFKKLPLIKSSEFSKIPQNSP